ncbi:hypothetical protein ACFXKW_28215 [Streptomyces sp. NPDC059193]|uniref:hypothetical protein n=1 Tax=Streptomyces sp. NPDC059193 TaxID=3346763 RepID=UPI0036835808
MTTVTRTLAAAAAFPVAAPFTSAAPSQALAVRNFHDDVIKRLAGVSVPEEGARRATRVAMLRECLARIGGWLMALPVHPDTRQLLDQVIRWQDVQPRDPAQPDDRFIAALRHVAKQAERHLNTNAVGLAYAVIAPSADDRTVLATLEDTAHRFCGQAPLWYHDNEPTPGYARLALRTVLDLAERRKFHVLVIPSLDHLPPDDPRDESRTWTLTGIWERLRAHGIRLVTVDHGRPLSNADVEDPC